jgi:hypothetical protein
MDIIPFNRNRLYLELGDILDGSSFIVKNRVIIIGGMISTSTTALIINTL